ncbi:hypothetical protein BRC77_04105 [Halobacteriales archaeon QH_8_64_26]|nr:MAG: hypothetical protein BRC77_04105 [Halobacteriales archaeon QH_8_64_26]
MASEVVHRTIGAGTETREPRAWDVGYDPEAVSEYDRLDCGALLVAQSQPGQLPTVWLDAAQPTDALE